MENQISKKQTPVKPTEEKTQTHSLESQSNSALQSTAQTTDSHSKVKNSETEIKRTSVSSLSKSGNVLNKLAMFEKK